VKTVTLTVVVDDEKLETGLWCGRCLLPSGWRVPILGMSIDGVYQLGTIARCRDCDRPL
jgi:hypothetical protein